MGSSAAAAWTRRIGPPADRALAALLLGGCAVVPLLFTVAQEDVFALPKTVALLTIGVVGFALLALRGSGSRAPLGALDVGLLAFLVLNLGASVLSADPLQSLVGEPLQYQGLLAVLLYVGSFHLARTSARTHRRLKLLFASVVAGATLVSGYALVQRAGLDPLWGDLHGISLGRVFSTIGQPNALAAYLVLAMPLSAVLALHETSRARRAILLLALGTMAGALAFTLSRGGYAGLVVTASVLAQPLVRRLRAPAVTCGLLGCLAAVAVVSWLAPPVRASVTDVWNRALSAGDAADPSIQKHLALWAAAVAIARDHPLLGTGPDTFAEVFPRYRDAVLTPPAAAALSGFRPESPHNVYLAIAAGAGIPALLAYLALIVGVILRIMGALRAATGDPGSKLTLLAVLAAMAGHLVTDAFMTAEVTGAWLSWVLMGAGLRLAESGARHRA